MTVAVRTDRGSLSGAQIGHEVGSGSGQGEGVREVRGCGSVLMRASLCLTNLKSQTVKAAVH